MNFGKKPLRLSHVAERLLWLDGKRFSLRDYPMFRPIYDGRYKSTLMLTGRQVSKSTSLANFIITESISIPFFKTYYVAPTREQTQIFSNTRLGKTLSYSPLVKKHFQSPEHADRVLHRSYTNGSENGFTYASEDADRARGFSSDRVCFDKDAYALTDKGWKLVKDITCEDVLADVDDEGNVQWNKPTEVIRYKHTGPMVTFRHHGFKLRVTGDHRMWVNFRVKDAPEHAAPDRYEFVPALDLAETERLGFKMTGSARFEGRDKGRRGRHEQKLGKFRDKHIPRRFFQHPELLEELLRGLYTEDEGTLRTRSRRLAEDVQEAWLHLGRSVDIKELTADDEPLYEIRPTQEQQLIFWREEFAKKERVLVEQVTDEEVYCFTLPHHRPLVKGTFSSKPVITGQCYDEFQDMNYDAVVPVVNATMKNSKYRFETYAGTPKTMEASIQYLWDNSTQSEWVMKCEGCNKYNFVASVKSLGKHGPICLKCGKGLNPRNGQWVDMRIPEDTGRVIKGFHIPQPIMPANIALCYDTPEEQEAAQSRWNDILHDMTLYSESKFKNEVLGVSDSIGTRLISLEELQALCTAPRMQAFPDHQSNMKGVTMVTAGVDWSGGGITGMSRTVLHIWGWVPAEQKLRTLYYEIFPGSNPVHSVRRIAEICNLFGVGLVMGDSGEGHLANASLRETLGLHRVVAVQYGSYAKPMNWNGHDKWQIDRTTVIDNYMMLLKRKGVTYLPYEEMRTPIKDVLNVFEEVTPSGKKVWRHSPQAPDDSLHAQLFGWLAWKMMVGDGKFYA